MIKGDQVLLRGRAPEPRRAHGGRAANETHTDRRWRESYRRGEFKKGPHYDLNNITHHSQTSSASTKVMLDNEAPQGRRPSLLNSFSTKCIFLTSTRLALLEAPSFCRGFDAAPKATFMPDRNPVPVELQGPLMTIFFVGVWMKGFTTLLYIFMNTASLQTRYRQFSSRIPGFLHFILIAFVKVKAWAFPLPTKAVFMWLQVFCPTLLEVCVNLSVRLGCRRRGSLQLQKVSDGATASQLKPWKAVSY